MEFQKYNVKKKRKKRHKERKQTKTNNVAKIIKKITADVLLFSQVPQIQTLSWLSYLPNLVRYQVLRTLLLQCYLKEEEKETAKKKKEKRVTEII